MTSSPTTIPPWNTHDMEALLELAHAYLEENACMLVILLEYKEVRSDVMNYGEACEFRLPKIDRTSMKWSSL